MFEDTGQESRAARRDSYTADSLLAVAVGVFNQRGYDGTSMEDLARASGITKSSIYHHVRSKEHLLRLAVGRALDLLFAVLDEPGSTTGPAIERLEHVAGRTVEVLIADLPYVTLLLRVRGNTETERWALERRREFDHRVAEIAREAMEAGDLRDDVDARLATRLLFGMINSISEWYRAGGGESAAAVADAVTGLAFQGLRRRDG
jgi:AcrR family transcriptional regulator